MPLTKQKECKNESARTDTYLDIAVDVKGFGEARAVRSVYEVYIKQQIF